MGIFYHVPPGTRLVSYTLYRTVALNNYFNWSLIEAGDISEVGTAPRRETCWTMGSPACASLGDGTVSAASAVGHDGIDTSGLALWIDCNPAPCSGDGARPRVALHRLDAVLADRSPPVFTSPPAGDLLDTSQPGRRRALGDVLGDRCGRRPVRGDARGRRQDHAHAARRRQRRALPPAVPRARPVPYVGHGQVVVRHGGAARRPAHASGSC